MGLLVPITRHHKPARITPTGDWIYFAGLASTCKRYSVIDGTVEDIGVGTGFSGAVVAGDFVYFGANNAASAMRYNTLTGAIESVVDSETGDALGRGVWLI